LDNLDDYEKHFTVMNYKPTVTLKQIHYNEFIPEFEQQNPDFKWSQLEAKIFKMIRQVFEGASKEKPPKGMPHNVQSRAMYAVDLMLDWQTDENNVKTIEPMICEINYQPDCTRACTYHPSFYNDIFNTLFMDSLDHRNVTKI
jgi:tubulin--tyrosine ligase-like protein 12